MLCSLGLDPNCTDQFRSYNKHIPRVLLSNFSQHMPFGDLNESTIFEITEDSSEESKNSYDNTICG